MVPNKTDIMIYREELDSIPINQPTFNIAKIIKDCPTLQRLVDLGVDLSQWEERDFNGQNMEIAIRIDFDADVKPRVQWLIDHGVDLNNQAVIFTSNPNIFNISLEQMNSVVEYLKAKKFPRRSISEIILGSYGKWLSFSVVDIDSKLGYFQNNFKLSGNEVRQLAKNEPNLIIWAGVPFQ